MPASSCLFNEMDRTGEDNIESRAFQLAYELSMLRFPDTATSVSEPESPSDFGQLLNPMSSIGLEETRSKKSQNMTECVPVPSSEHVAEIVGRQGKILVIHTYIFLLNHFNLLVILKYWKLFLSLFIGTISSTCFLFMAYQSPCK